MRNVILFRSSLYLCLASGNFNMMTHIIAEEKSHKLVIN